MFSELHFKTLENADREVTRLFAKLRKACASRNKDGIKHAEMDYFHALQHPYAAGQDAVSEQGR